MIAAILSLVITASRAEARALRSQGQFAACAAQYEGLGAHARYRGGTEQYRAAACWALNKEPRRAFADLEASVDAGYDDLDGAQKDPDLLALHSYPEWTHAMKRLEATRRAEDAVDLARLTELRDADQADRGAAFDPAKAAPRDAVRRAEVKRMLDAKALKTSRDYRRAALIFQHGDTPADYEEAHRLALEAVRLDPTSGGARWLAAASEDRLLKNEGKEQKWGTQFNQVGGPDGGYPEAPDSIFVLWPVDRTITDEQRAEWNVQPLAEAKARAGKHELAPK